MAAAYNDVMIQRAAQDTTMRFRVTRPDVLRYLGYAGQRVDTSLEERLDGMISRCEWVSNPGWMFSVFPLSAGEGGLRLDGTTLVLRGADIQEHLAGARECAVMAATAGLGNERELRRLSALNGLDGMMFDAAATALVETVADACNAAIVAEAKARGMYAKWRYSPGYGDFPLEIQSQIVRVLGADKQLGITVTDSSLLIPAKSVTAFVGLFDEPQDDKRSCAHCGFAQYCDLPKKGTPCYR